MNFVGTGKKLTARDYATEAVRAGLPVATLQGVIDVEAAGSGFDSKNRSKILTEPHIFYARLGAGPARDRAVKLGVAYPKWGAKPYPKTSDANYARLAVMMSIDEKAALESTSWGLTQIMGYNCKDAGFTDVYAMVEAYKTGEAAQLDAFVHLLAEWNLVAVLVRRDARAFALKYNGRGFDKNHYDTKLLTTWHHRDQGSTMHTLLGAVPTDVRGPAIDPDAAPVPVTIPTPSNPITDGLSDEQSTSTITQVQTRLKELGYIEVGVIDGGVNGMHRTQTAISSFRLNNGLPLTDAAQRPLGIDADLLVALTTAAPRQISEWRANATPADVRAANPAVQSTFHQKVFAFFGMVGAGAATSVNGLLSTFSDARDKLGPVEAAFASVPGWVWGVGSVALAFVMWRMSAGAEKTAVEKFRTGEHL